MRSQITSQALHAMKCDKCVDNYLSYLHIVRLGFPLLAQICQFVNVSLLSPKNYKPGIVDHLTTQKTPHKRLQCRQRVQVHFQPINGAATIFIKSCILVAPTSLTPALPSTLTISSPIIRPLHPLHPSRNILPSRTKPPSSTSKQAFFLLLP